MLRNLLVIGIGKINRKIVNMLTICSLKLEEVGESKKDLLDYCGAMKLQLNNLLHTKNLLLQHLNEK